MRREVAGLLSLDTNEPDLSLKWILRHQCGDLGGEICLEGWAASTSYHWEDLGFVVAPAIQLERVLDGYFDNAHWQLPIPIQQRDLLSQIQEREGLR